MPKPTITWVGGVDGVARIIDQTRLPLEYVLEDVKTVEDMYDAIKALKVRGAPAIGVAGAYGLVLAAVKPGLKDASNAEKFLSRLADAARYLKSSRPTAVNLAWAVERAQRAAHAVHLRGVPAMREALLTEAQAIREEDGLTCRRMADVGQQVVPDVARIMTHCNAGALATADYGTALGVVYRAHELGKKVSVYADETRPLLQGSRLTAWELMDAGIDVTVICDNMAATLMAAGRVDLVIVGADRIASNGDTANKVGTMGLAVMASHFHIPFYVAAPASTFDLDIASGADIPIEERSPEEITEGFGRRTAPEGVKVFNPAFDVTPARLITAIITERGLIRNPSVDSVMAVIGRLVP